MFLRLGQRARTRPSLAVRLAVLALALLPAAPARAGDGWWDDAWSHRRRLVVGGAARGSRPDDLAVAEVPTLGLARPDGADLRVIDRDGKERPVAVLASGLEDRALVAFEAPYHGEYTLYFGNPAASPGRRLDRPVPGLVLEVRELGSGPEPSDWPAMKRLLAASPVVTGRWAWPAPSLGFDPLGPARKGIFHFRGTLDVKARGPHVFATNSRDASFVLVDDRVVAEWPGWHGHAGGERADHAGTVVLEPGPHRLEYVNAFAGACACTLGWKRPGDERLAPIPAEAFAGAWVATPRAAEARDLGAVADFAWSVEDDLALEGRDVVRIRFESLARGTSCHWRFGDGTGATGATVDHVFLERARASVTLDVDGREVTQALLARPSRGHAGRRYEQRIEAYAAIVRDYPTDGLSAAACLELGMICHEARVLDAATRGLRAALEKGLVPRAQDEIDAVMALHDDYREAGRSADAAWVCERVLAGGPPDALATRFLVLEAEARIDEGKLDLASACLGAVLGRYKKAATDWIRWARIRQGDVALARGDRAAAATILEDAENGAVWRRRKGDPSTTLGTGFEATAGSHSLAFEEHLRGGETAGALAEVRAWEWDQPTVLLSGLPCHLRGRALLAAKHPDAAVRELERALAIDPRATFADEALYWKGCALEARGDRAAARATFERLARELPESTLAAKAKEKLR